MARKALLDALGDMPSRDDGDDDGDSTEADAALAAELKRLASRADAHDQAANVLDDHDADDDPGGGATVADAAVGGEATLQQLEAAGQATGQAAAATTTPLPAARTTAVATEPPWTPCAKEGEACACAGAVRYGGVGGAGATEAWRTKTATEMKQRYRVSLVCGNGPFGDPTPGYPKVCHYMIQPLVELYGGCMVVLKVS